MMSYQIQIDVTVRDLEQLKAYALKLALAAGMTESEFNDGEHDEPIDNVSYWLGWAFDSGTPDNCGFQIETSRVEDTGVDDNSFHPESPEGRAWEDGDKSSVQS